MLSSTTKNLTFLWCIPRSLSTAFEKMMSQTSQFKVVGEPFIDVYKKSLLSSEDLSSAQNEFDETCNTLLTESSTVKTFVKDMGYHAYPFISKQFIAAINNTFLIRDPKLSIPSLYRMRADFAEAETGFEGQYKLFKRIAEVTEHYPLVVDGESLRREPDGIVRDYFEYIQQPMPTDVLTWQRGSRDDWLGRESWHIDAINSTTFEQSTKPIDLTGLPAKVLESIERNTYFYQKMLAYVAKANTRTQLTAVF